MHSAIVFIVALIVVQATLAAPDGNRKYTDKYDHVDVDSILRNDRILTSYVKCMLDQGPCTAEGRELKADLPDALESECSKCSPRQKEIVRKAARHLMAKRPNDWAKLQQKYDPESSFRAQFARFLEE